MSVMALLLVAVGVDTGPAAPPATPSGSARAEQGLELWAGYSPGSPSWGVLGGTPGQQLALVAVRWTRRLRTGRAVALDYTAELVPIAQLSPPYVRGGTEGAPPCVPHTACVYARSGGLFSRNGASGMGGAPLGLTWTFRPGRAVEPTLAATGGALWFDRRVPTNLAARFNFTASVEAGLRWQLAKSLGVTLAYRFHHISNASTRPDNPGIASNLLTLGARWSIGGRPASAPTPRPPDSSP